MHNNLIILVKVASSDANFLHLDILDTADSCPHCARGEGCGARPWFRGFFRSNHVVLPCSHNESWQPGDLGTLYIPTAILHQLMLQVYGWPLFTFIGTIFLLHHCTESLQFVGSIMAALLATFLSRRYAERRLQRALCLMSRDNPADIQLCQPENC